MKISPTIARSGNQTARAVRLGATLNSQLSTLNSSSAFTLIEIAISLAVIGIALVAIIGVLPLGMNVQRENREGTVINQDATLFIEAISKGARGMNDLTNYVFAITNYWTPYVNYVPGPVKVNGYVFSASSLAAGYPGTSAPINNGTNIIGLLSTPEFTDPVTGAPSDSQAVFNGNFNSNHIIAYVRSISGAAAEKPPQDNPILRGGQNDSGDAFAYRLLCVNAAVPVNTNLFNLSDVQQAYSRQIAANLHELRLTFLWPILPNGRLGNGRQSYRTLVAGQIVTNLDLFYFYQPQSFTNAP